MELAHILGVLRSRRLLVGLVALLAVAAAATIKLVKHSVPTGAASAQIVVDSPQSALADLRQDTAPLDTRASVFAQLMASQAIVSRVARITAIPVGQITAQGPFTGAGAAQNVITPSEARSAQVTSDRKVYRLTFVPQDLTPVVTVSAFAPSPQAAAKLADGVYPAVAGYIASLQTQRGPSTTPNRGARRGKPQIVPLIPPRFRVTLRQLGPAQAGASSNGSITVIAALAFVGILLLGSLGILGLEGVRSRRGPPPAGPPPGATDPAEVDVPAPGVNGRGREPVPVPSADS